MRAICLFGNGIFPCIGAIFFCSLAHSQWRRSLHPGLSDQSSCHRVDSGITRNPKYTFSSVTKVIAFPACNKALLGEESSREC